MNARLQWLLAAVLIAFTGTAMIASGNSVSAEDLSRPPLMRFTGTISSVTDEDGKGQLDQALVLRLPGNTKVLLTVERADNLSWTETRLGVLKDIVPPRLYVSGPEEYIAVLQNPDSLGKRFSLLGYLYISENRFDMTSLEKAEVK